ncbi:hypothetical protein [Synechococcus sp. WH 7805]|nr:hypothetical protein [Synechococcus sp. WH 7805]
MLHHLEQAMDQLGIRRGVLPRALIGCHNGGSLQSQRNRTQACQ